VSTKGVLGIALHFENVSATQATDYQTNLRTEYGYDRLGNLLVCSVSHNTTVMLSTVIPYV
jgi:hypothetical protein